MTIYLDVVFLVNLLYETAILYICLKVMKIPVSFWRVTVSSAVGSILYCGCLLAGMPYEKPACGFLASVFIATVSTMIALGAGKLHKSGGVLLMHYGVSFAAAGLLQLVRSVFPDGYLVLTGAGAVVFIGMFCIKIRQLLFQELLSQKRFYHVKIVLNGRRTEGRGLMDTGNGLFDPVSRAPVILVNSRIAAALLQGEAVSSQRGFRLIPFTSIGKKRGVLEAFLSDYIELETEQTGTKALEVMHCEKVLCAVTDRFDGNQRYDIILHPSLL